LKTSDLPATHTIQGFSHMLLKTAQMINAQIIQALSSPLPVKN
jgi:hypothetical protein